MKRAKSNLIESFLLHVEKEYITGLDDSSGPLVLERMVTALQDILKGEDSDKALAIKRQRGQPLNVETIMLALFIYQCRQAGDYWSVVENKVNKWLEDRGSKPISLSWMKAIHKENSGWISTRDTIVNMVDLVK